MKSSKFNINILTTNGPQYDYLIFKLENNFNVNITIREKAKCQRQRMLKQKKYWRYFCNRYQYWVRKILRYNSYRQRYFKISTPIQCKIVDVEDINSKNVIETLAQNPANLCIVMGTSILNEYTISACNSSIINIHGGYLPDYRGNNCIYFAYNNNDFSKIANTIHYIDSGIDTGDIIEIVFPEITENDNPETLYCKAKKKAINRLITLVEIYQETKTLPRTVQNKKCGRLYLTEDRNPLTSLLFLIKRIVSKREK